MASTLDRLRLGQGVTGGAGSLPSRGFPDLTPRPPLGVPRVKQQLSPTAYATDVTPARPVASSVPLPSTEGQGGALLARGAFKPIIPGKIKLGKGEKETVKVLRSPDTAYNPKNSKQLQLLTRPGPKLQAVIDADPQLKLNHMSLLQHIITQGPTKLPGQDLIKSLHDSVSSGKMTLPNFLQSHQSDIAALDPAGRKRLSDAATIADRIDFSRKQRQASMVPPISSGWDHVIGNAVDQAFNITTGIVPGVYKTVTDPVGTAHQIIHQEGHLYTPLIQGNLGEFAHRWGQQPLSPVLDALTVASAGLGAGGRIASVSDALSSLRAVSKVGELPSGASQVGEFTVKQAKDGLWDVRRGNKFIAGKSFPDKQAAIAHAQSLASGGLTDKNAIGVLTKAFMNPTHRGGLIDAYERARGIQHTAEHEQIAKEIMSAMESPSVGTKRTFSSWRQQVTNDLQKTREYYAGQREQIALRNPGHAGGRLTSGALAAAHQSLNEALDMVRLGAIYLRPAYLPNNWAGNTFMNLTHQGFLAPINLAKSVVMSKHMNPQAVAGVRAAMEMNPAEAGMHGVGYAKAISQPLVHTMGALADQPARDAAFLHEARRAGYRSLGQVEDLMMRFHKAGGQGPIAQEVGNIARRAQEEVVKFGKLSDSERSVARNLLFVYNWVRGATRYAGRFPLQHPIQTAWHNQAAQVGNAWVQSQMGGVPHFLLGSIPVGHDKDGNPILINPFALNPLGTGLQVAQMVQGGYQALQHPTDFNKYASLTPLDALNPMTQAAVKSFTGGAGAKTFGQQVEQSMAPLNLYKSLKHPGSGSTFPMSRSEALGHYIVGALWPRHADKAAIASALARENIGHPEALIPQQMADYKKATGAEIDPKIVSGYRGDLTALADIKHFQQHYASSIGNTGFSKLPPINQAKAALQYLSDRKIATPQELNEYQQAMAEMPNDEAMRSFANAMWGLTGAGQYKQAWDSLMKSGKANQLTRERK